MFHFVKYIFYSLIWTLEEFRVFLWVETITFISSYLRNRAYAHLKISLELMLHHSTILFGTKKSSKFEIQKMDEKRSFCHYSF